MAALIRKLTKFSRREIDSLWKQARRVVKHAGFDILHAPRSEDFGKLLIIASKKIGNAPTRNKIRRQVKHIFYENKLYEGEKDWIVIVKPMAPKMTFIEMQQLITRAQEK